MWVCVWVCAHTYRCLQMPEDGVRPLKAGVTGSYEPSDMETHTEMAMAVGHFDLSCFHRHHDFLTLPAP